MRISDWSSDVCSSDLGTRQGFRHRTHVGAFRSGDVHRARAADSVNAPSQVGRPGIDDWIRFGSGLAGVALAAVLFLSIEEPLTADLLLVASLVAGELGGRGLVAVRHRNSRR